MGLQTCREVLASRIDKRASHPPVHLSPQRHRIVWHAPLLAFALFNHNVYAQRVISSACKERVQWSRVARNRGWERIFNEIIAVLGYMARMVRGGIELRRIWALNTSQGCFMG